MDNNNNDGASNSPACAACRHQRKKCKVRECVIWPHFPSDRMEDFQAVHRVFGIANVTKMMKELDNDQRAAVANSLLWESKSWTDDPVHGPLGRCNRLQQELNDLKASMLQFQPLPDSPSANNSNLNRYSSSTLLQVRDSLVISNGGFQNPYPTTTFGHGIIDQTWPGPIRLPYNQTPITDDLIRGDEYVETLMFSDALDLSVRGLMDNVGTFFSSPPTLPIRGSSPPSLPIRGEDNNIIRGDNQHNVTTNLSNSSNPPVKREGDVDDEH